jgi:hypothetical protein
MKNSMEVPQKLRYQTTIWLSNPKEYIQRKQNPCVEEIFALPWLLQDYSQ